MYKPLIYLMFVFVLFSCTSDKQQADLIVFNANIYTVNEALPKAEAFAISNGKFIGIGTTKEIQSGFTSKNSINLKGKTVVPGLIDGHCHFFGLGQNIQKVDLVGTKSYQEILDKLVQYQKDRNPEFIQGRGWDQNDWDNKEYPTKEKLDALFPKTPVVLTRVDGHAMLVNQAALNLAGIDDKTKVEGGEIIKNNGKITGVLIDNAKRNVYAIIPKITKKENIQALKDAEAYCLNLGLTTVSDAGLSKSIIDLIDSLQQNDAMKIKVYAMVSFSPENLDYYLDKGPIKTERLNILKLLKVFLMGRPHKYQVSIC